MLKLPIEDRKEIAENTISFFFALRGNAFPFRPGQYVQVTTQSLLYEDPKGNNRVLSIVSSPNSREHLEVATRIRDSGFKKTLAEIPLGMMVGVEGPFGAFVLPQQSKRSVVLIAGGIGITPFISMIRYATEEKLSHRITLLYSNHTRETTAFFEELLNLEKQNPNFKFVPTITDPGHPKQAWNGRIGRIDAAFVKETILDLIEPIWYIAGPPTMVAALRQTLSAVGASEDDIRVEEFSGYP